LRLNNTLLQTTSDDQLSQVYMYCEGEGELLTYSCVELISSEYRAYHQN